jgi:hypothetical protein
MDLNLEEYLEQYMGQKGIKYSVSSYKDNEELKTIVGKFRNKSKISMKACFHNAALMMKADPRIAYCEGYTSIGIGGGFPIEHAWNSFGDFHFDMTSEMLFKGDLGKGHNEYIELYKSYDQEEVKKAISAAIRPYMRRRHESK